MAGERVFVGLGSNLADPIRQLTHAVQRLSSAARMRVIACSSLYQNPPMGPQDQPQYVNAVVELGTSLEPLALLAQLLAIENAQGRVRSGERWGPRTLDLDLLLYGERQMNHTRLCLPHPGTHERDFVIHPLAEIAPEVRVPSHGRVATLASRITASRLVKVAAPVVPARHGRGS